MFRNIIRILLREFVLNSRHPGSPGPCATLPGLPGSAKYHGSAASSAQAAALRAVGSELEVQFRHKKTYRPKYAQNTTRMRAN